MCMFEPYAVAAQASINEDDREIIDGLEHANFKIKGKGGPGMFYMYLWKGGVSILLIEHLVSKACAAFMQGYYIDVGCLSLIIDGKVKIKQGQEVQQFKESMHWY